MKIELEERLRRDLRAGRLPGEPAGLLAEATSRAARRARRVRAAAAAAAAVLVVATVGVLVGRSSSSRSVEPSADSSETTVAPTSVTTVPPSSTTTTMMAPGSGLADVAWQPIAPNPLGERSDAVTVWTGSEVLTWGGTDGDQHAHADGAAYDPASNSWRLTAPGDLSPRVDELAFWTGSEMLVIGGANPDGALLLPQLAAYDPSTDSWSWRATPPFESVTTADVVVWTGDGIVVWTHDGEAARYDVATDTWTALPAAPIAPRSNAAAVWTGTEVVVWGGASADGRDNLHDGAALDPSTSTWRTIAPSPLSGRVAAPVWTGQVMVVSGGYAGTGIVTALADGATYDPATDTWTSIRQGPAHPGFVAVWTGRVMVQMAKGHAVVWDPATDAWSDWDATPGGGPTSQQPPLWTGRDVLAFGPAADGRPGAGGIALRPDLVPID